MSNSGGQVLLQNNNATALSGIDLRAGSGGGNINFQPFGSTGGSKGTMDPNGNFGIGTTSPYAKLSIANVLATTSPLFLIASSSPSAGVATSTLFTVAWDGGVTFISATGTNNIFSPLLVGTVGGFGSVIASSSATSTFASNVQITVNGTTTCPYGSGFTVCGGAIANAERIIATSTYMVLQWASSTQYLIRPGAAAFSIDFSSTTPDSIAGQTLRVLVCNPGVAAGAVTWKDSRIRWGSGTVPSQTTTANKCDLWSFVDTAGTSTRIYVGSQFSNI